VIEVWRKVPDLADRFEVSNLGSVRTLAHTYTRVDPLRGTVCVRLPGRLLKCTPTNQGYLTVNVGSAGRCHNVLAHTLVAKAFFGAPLPGQEVNHKNGNKKDNRAINLEWVTRSENVAHSHRELTRALPKSARKVTVIHKDGSVLFFGSMSEVARYFGVTVRTVAIWLAGGGNRRGLTVKGQH